jgi:hypothetical protein
VIFSPKLTHFHFIIIIKEPNKHLKSLTSSINLLLLLLCLPYFSIRDLWILAINCILHTICSTMSSSPTCSSIVSHKPFKLLWVLSHGVHLMNTICEEYFVLAWMPHKYLERILDNYISHPKMLEANNTLIHVWLFKSNISPSHCIEAK